MTRTFFQDSIVAGEKNSKIRKKMKILFFISIILLSLKSFALTNSQPAEDSVWQSVSFIRTESFDENGELVPGYCNATLINSKVLISAAHCVYDSIKANKYEIQVQLGEYIYINRPSGERVRIGYKTKLTHLSRAQFITYSDSKPGPAGDFALIILDQELTLPSDFPFAQVVSHKESLGIVSRVNNYWPTIVSVNPFAEISTSDSKRFATLNDISQSWRGYFESNSSSRVSPGDSGAPLFIRTGKSWKLMGIVKGRADSFFSNWDVIGILEPSLCGLASKSSLDLKQELCRD